MVRGFLKLSEPNFLQVTEEEFVLMPLPDPGKPNVTLIYEDKGDKVIDYAIVGIDVPLSSTVLQKESSLNSIVMGEDVSFGDLDQSYLNGNKDSYTDTTSYTPVRTKATSSTTNFQLQKSKNNGMTFAGSSRPKTISN